MIRKYGDKLIPYISVDLWKKESDYNVSIPMWFRIFLTITVTATHLSWNSFMLTEMCTVPI